MKIIHLSDPHLKRGKYDLYGLNPKRRLRLAIKNLNKYHKDADFAIITGDLLDKGDVRTYGVLKRLIAKSIVPIYTIIGNHDNRENYLKVFTDSFNSDGFVQGSFVKDNRAFIFLDTMQPGTCIGDMCDVRFEWFENELQKYRDKSVYIFMHHPPMDVGIYLMDIVGFASKERFKDILKNNSNIKHIFFGHVHRIISGQYSGASFSCTRSTNHQVAYQFSKKELYFTNEERATYSVIEFSEDNILINTHEYLDDNGVYLADYW